MKQTKLIISTVAVLMAAMPGAKAVVCKIRYTSPDNCFNRSPTTTNYETTWTVSECTGGSVTSFGGERRCSETDGTYATQGNPSSTSGIYCWCRLTSPAASAWVFLFDRDSADNCSQDCANRCGYNALNISTFQDALFNAID